MARETLVGGAGQIKECCMIITVDDLRKIGACNKNVLLFEEAFGSELDTDSDDIERLADQDFIKGDVSMNIPWAAKRFLTLKGFSEYVRRTKEIKSRITDLSAAKVEERLVLPLGKRDAYRASAVAIREEEAAREHERATELRNKQVEMYKDYRRQCALIFCELLKTEAKR